MSLNRNGQILRQFNSFWVTFLVTVKVSSTIGSRWKNCLLLLLLPLWLRAGEIGISTCQSLSPWTVDFSLLPLVHAGGNITSHWQHLKQTYIHSPVGITWKRRNCWQTSCLLIFKFDKDFLLLSISGVVGSCYVATFWDAKWSKALLCQIGSSNPEHWVRYWFLFSYISASQTVQKHHCNISINICMARY